MVFLRAKPKLKLPLFIPKKPKRRQFIEVRIAPRKPAEAECHATARQDGEGRLSRLATGPSDPDGWLSPVATRAIITAAAQLPVVLS